MVAYTENLTVAEPELPVVVVEAVVVVAVDPTEVTAVPDMASVCSASAVLAATVAVNVPPLIV